jgi:hypothetical protein
MSVVSPGVLFRLVSMIRDRLQNVKVHRVRLWAWPSLGILQLLAYLSTQRRCRSLQLRCNTLLDALTEDCGEGPPSAAHATALSEAGELVSFIFVIMVPLMFDSLVSW